MKLTLNNVKKIIFKNILFNNLNIWNFLKKSNSKIINKIYMCFENPTCLELFQNKKILNNDLIIQYINEENYESALKTIEYIQKFNINIFGVSENFNVNGKIFLVNDYIKNIDEFFPIKIQNIYNFCKFLKDLEIPFIDYKYIKYKQDIKLPLPEKNYIPLIYKYEPLYLKNLYYRKTGEYLKETPINLNFYNNFYDEILYHNLEEFSKTPENFLKNNVIIILDPTRRNERSGISTYLQNISIFFITYFYKYNIKVLYIKNNFNQRDNRELFRKNIGDTFNKYTNYFKNILFIDSEAHFPGIYLDKKFIKIIILHCSSVLANYKNNVHIKENLAKNIMKNEIKNIKNSKYIVSPSETHKKTELELFNTVENIDSFINIIPNYIESSYNEIIHPKNKKYDIIWIGRVQTLKGYEHLSKLSENLKIFTIHPGTENKKNNELIDNADDSDIFLKKTQAYKNCKCFLETSTYHSYSYTLLEAINNKLFLILNEECEVYSEIFKDDPLEKYVLYINLQDKNLSFKIREFIDHIKNISEDELLEMDKIYNNFLYKNFTMNYDFYIQIIQNSFQIKNSFRYSDKLNDYLENKKVIIVANGPNVKNQGGFIDSFDVVTRLNKSLPIKNENNYGSRTDILYNCINRSPDSGNWTLEYYNEVKNLTKWVVKAFPNLQWQGSFSFDQDKKYGATYDNYIFECMNLCPEKTSSFDINLYKLIESNIQSRPNTGILGIIDLLNYDIESLYIKGFTLFKGGYDKEYRNQNEEEVLSYMKKYDYHNQYRQNLFLKKFLYTWKFKIEMDKELENILKNI